MSRGMGRASLELISTCLDLLADVQPATVRGICYRLFAAGAIPDMSKASTQRVSRLLVNARENDEIPWEWIVDEQRAVERVSSWDSPQSFMRAVKRSYRKDLWTDQPERVEVWSEKGTIGGILSPVLDEHAVTFRVMKGFGSATIIHDAAEDSQDRPFAVLYVGDWDPSGLFMSEHDLPARLQRYGGEIDLIRVALIEEDLPGLPSFDAGTKTSDPRHRWFVERYGNRCWELDAMSPVDLRARVGAAVSGFIDADAWDRARKAEAAEIESINTVCANWQTLVSGGGGR